MSDELIEAQRYGQTVWAGARWRVQIRGTGFEARGETKGAAVSALLERLQSLLNDPDEAVIMCGDGSVIVARHGSYTTYRDGEYRGGTIFGGDMNHREVADRARRHAEQSYGGVLWEYPRRAQREGRESC